MCGQGTGQHYQRRAGNRQGRMKPDVLRRRALFFKAMGHPARLAILDAVVGGERCVGELREIVGSDLSTVSRHLAVLKNAGLLEDRKQGANVLYSLRVPCVLNFFTCVDAVLAATPPDPDLVSACQHSEESKICQKNALPQKRASRA